MSGAVRVGVAGWSLPPDIAAQAGKTGPGLARYAQLFDCVEINSSFHRPHRPATYARWAAETPSGFRFAVKTPRAITHEAGLRDSGGALQQFLGEIASLGDKLGPVLVQLPPKLGFDAVVAEPFFDELRARHGGAIVCEPRHSSWFGAAADELLWANRVARAAADPARHPLAGQPGGWRGLGYWRWHGSPRMYFSAYDEAALSALASAVNADEAGEVWCVFDNTGAGWAARNALGLQRRLKESA